MWSSLAAPFVLAFYWGYGFFHIPGVDNHAQHLERRRRSFLQLCRAVHFCDVDAARSSDEPGAPATSIRGVYGCPDCRTPRLVYALVTRRIGVRCERCTALLLAVRTFIVERDLRL